MGNKEKQWSAANAALAVSVITTIPTRARISTVLTEQNESSFRRDTETNARAGRATHSRKLTILFRRIDSNEGRTLDFAGELLRSSTCTLPLNSVVLR